MQCWETAAQGDDRSMENKPTNPQIATFQAVRSNAIVTLSNTNTQALMQCLQRSRMMTEETQSFFVILCYVKRVAISCNKLPSEQHLANHPLTVHEQLMS